MGRSCGSRPAARASDQGPTSLDVNGEQVRICRDEFGVPYVFADTNQGLFEAYGYTGSLDDPQT